MHDTGTIKDHGHLKPEEISQDEYFMDIFGRYLDLFVTFSFWSNFVYHYYWYPLWFTTLQIGSFGIVSFWKRYRDGIEFEKRFSFSSKSIKSNSFSNSNISMLATL